MMIIAVTGTPGTGKTTFSKLLADTFGYEYLDVNNIIKHHKDIYTHDKERDCKAVDTDKLNNLILKEIKKSKYSGVVVDSHLSHFMPPEIVDLVVVTSCNIRVLRDRLKKRNYAESKIRENMDSEIFGICKNEAEEEGHDVVKIEMAEGKEQEAINKVRNAIQEL